MKGVMVESMSRCRVTGLIVELNGDTKEAVKFGQIWALGIAKVSERCKVTF